MAQPLNRYKADLREMQFLLFEQFQMGQLLGQPPFTDWGEEEVRLVLDEVYKFAREVTGPLNQIGDQTGCKLVDGRVITPEGYADAWKKLYEAGWNQLEGEPDLGGQSAPLTLQNIADELISGSNTAFQMYPGLTAGAANLIAHSGTPQQRARFSGNMLRGKWAGTMCLTEPHAGSDVGDARTSARKLDNGAYSIKGTKIFISGGDHDMAQNVVHTVLARIEGAPRGTKGLSLFIVPRVRVQEDGSLGEANDVQVTALEHKMGIRSSATCVLNLGDNDGCEGLLCGGVEHKGILQMFALMNRARIMVGMQGVAAASSAYLNAVEYTKERKQGSSVKKGKDPDAPRVPIIEHPDVRRMLLDMKARVEGIRALGTHLTMHVDRARALAGKDDDRASYHKGQAELFTPLFKSYATDQGFQICATAIQAYGGAGFLEDHPVEQYCRDTKIFSIYEGTNHIQALDLIGRKLRMGEGQLVADFLADVATLVNTHRDTDRLAAAMAELDKASAAIQRGVASMADWAKARDVEMPPLFANRMLDMMAETAVGYLLLQGSAIAQTKLPDVSDTHPDRAFYEGKIAAGVYYALNVLPTVGTKADLMDLADRSALEIPDAGFGSF